MTKIVEINVRQTEMDRRRAMTDSCHRLKNDRVPVHIFCDSPFYCRLAGITIEEIYRSPEAMLRAQIFGWKEILEQIDCDVPEIPVGLDLGSCLTASAYGCEIAYQPGSVPGFHSWFKDEKDLPRLESVDMLKGGMRAQLLDYWQTWRGELNDKYLLCFNGGMPFRPTDNVKLPDFSEGPFTIACMICGMDTFCMICLDNPSFAHRVLDVITEKEIERLRHDFALQYGVPVSEIRPGSGKFTIGLADD